jgi:hypothetical protein
VVFKWQRETRHAHPYADFVELARICWRQSKVATTSEVCRTLRQMAQKYQQEAAKLNGGKLPDMEA